MATENTIPECLAIIYTAVDQVNETIVDGPKIARDPDAPLLDAEGGIDSLTLVNLVVAVEQLVFDKTRKTIVIADESIFSSESNPFRTLRAFSTHLETLLR